MGHAMGVHKAGGHAGWYGIAARGYTVGHQPRRNEAGVRRWAAREMELCAVVGRGVPQTAVRFKAPLAAVRAWRRLLRNAVHHPRAGALQPSMPF